MKTLSDLGVEVVGVSGDSCETQALFRKEHNLPYTLLSDSEGAVAKALGVSTRKGGTIKKKIGGKERELVRGVTTNRWTFVFGLDGKVAYKNDKVKATQDSKAVIEAVKALK